MIEIQNEFPFCDERSRDLWEQHRAYDSRHAFIKPLLIAILRTTLARHGRCSIQGACEDLREEHGLHIAHEYRSSYAREIMLECRDLAPHLKTRPSRYDGRVRR